MSKRRAQPKATKMETDTQRDFDGLIDSVDPETGEQSPIGYWLPDGVTPQDIGLEG